MTTPSPAVTDRHLMVMSWLESHYSPEMPLENPRALASMVLSSVFDDIHTPEQARQITHDIVGWCFEKLKLDGKFQAFVTALVSEAREKQINSPQCGMSGPQATGTFLGIHCILSCIRHDSVDCWHFSAQFVPHGRSTVENDWYVLGQLVGQTVTATNVTQTSRVASLTPDDDPPHLPKHWAWHGDGSGLDPHALEAYRYYFSLTEDQRKALMHMATDASKPHQHPVRSGVRVGRNDQCPCGSGKKFEKCHGN